MNVFCKFLVWTAASTLLVFGAKANEPQQGQEGVHISDGVICGTAEQAKSFVANHQDAFASGDAVESNADRLGQDKNECLVAGIAYIPGKELDRVRPKDVTYVVQEILIVAIVTPFGFQKIKPDLAYTIVKVDERGA